MIAVVIRCSNEKVIRATHPARFSEERAERVGADMGGVIVLENWEGIYLMYIWIDNNL